MITDTLQTLNEQVVVQQEQIEILKCSLDSLEQIVTSSPINGLTILERLEYFYDKLFERAFIILGLGIPLLTGTGFWLSNNNLKEKVKKQNKAIKKQLKSLKEKELANEKWINITNQKIMVNAGDTNAKLALLNLGEDVSSSLISIDLMFSAIEQFTQAQAKTNIIEGLIGLEDLIKEVLEENYDVKNATHLVRPYLDCIKILSDDYIRECYPNIDNITNLTLELWSGKQS